MILIELTIVACGVLGVIGVKIVAKKIGYKVKKRKLWKILNVGFDTLDMDNIKWVVDELNEFDVLHSTQKLIKYVRRIVKRFNEDPEKPMLNEENVLKMVRDSDFSHPQNIFDEDEEEKDEQMEIVDEKLEEIEKRRKEIILRKNEIRQQMSRRESHMNGRRKRKAGGMG